MHEYGEYEAISEQVKQIRDTGDTVTSTRGDLVCHVARPSALSNIVDTASVWPIQKYGSFLYYYCVRHRRA